MTAGPRARFFGTEILGLRTPNDEQARMVLPIYLAFWALDDFTSIPVQYPEPIERFPDPTLDDVTPESGCS